MFFIQTVVPLFHFFLIGRRHCVWPKDEDNAEVNLAHSNGDASNEWQLCLHFCPSKSVLSTGQYYCLSVADSLIVFIITVNMHGAVPVMSRARAASLSAKREKERFRLSKT